MENNLNLDGVGNTAPQKFMKRLYPPKDVYRFLRDMLASMGDMRKGRKENLVSEEFSERIMLAVTEVNGCRYCSYFHTQVALKAGLDESEISDVLSGDFQAAPVEELQALLFAQHYADQAGKPEEELVNKLLDNYGDAKGRAIIGNIRAITVGNAWGNAFDALRLRLKGQPINSIKLGGELVDVLGLPFMLPVAALHNWIAPRKIIEID
jgi:AhpD family alkylhydroperoxidase